VIELQDHERRNAALEQTNDQEGIRWLCCDLQSPLLKRAAQLFSEGMTVREVAATLRISKSEAGRLRIRASEDGLLSLETGLDADTQQIMVQ
jgi:hypothetical protein